MQTLQTLQKPRLGIDLIRRWYGEESFELFTLRSVVLRICNPQQASYSLICPCPVINHL